MTRQNLLTVQLPAPRSTKFYLQFLPELFKISQKWIRKFYATQFETFLKNFSWLFFSFFFLEHIFHVRFFLVLIYFLNFYVNNKREFHTWLAELNEKKRLRLIAKITSIINSYTHIRSRVLLFFLSYFGGSFWDKLKGEQKTVNGFFECEKTFTYLKNVKITR